jgi:hypothetical protein
LVQSEKGVGGYGREYHCAHGTKGKQITRSTRINFRTLEMMRLATFEC